MTDDVLRAAARAAIILCTARACCVLVPGAGDRLVAVAYASSDETLGLDDGAELDREQRGIAHYVLSVGQSLAVSPSAGQPTPLTDLSAFLGAPVTTALAVPCVDGEATRGVLVLVDRVGQAAFGIDELEVAEVLGAVVGAALGDAVRPGTGSTLDERLAKLAGLDAERHRRTRAAIEALLGD